MAKDLLTRLALVVSKIMLYAMHAPTNYVFPFHKITIYKIHPASEKKNTHSLFICIPNIIIILPFCFHCLCLSHHSSFYIYFFLSRTGSLSLSVSLATSLFICIHNQLPFICIKLLARQKTRNLIICKFGSLHDTTRNGKVVMYTIRMNGT